MAQSRNKGANANVIRYNVPFSSTAATGTASGPNCHWQAVPVQLFTKLLDALAIS
jgi:hypothetical protein